MAVHVEQILEDALQLSPADRARLADSLIGSLDEPEPGVDKAWAEEVIRRSREYEEGKSLTISWNELRDAVRQEFAAKDA